MANEFSGFIDEVAVYPTALSATRMRQHYRTAIGAPGAYSAEVLADNPTLYYRLADVAGTASNVTGTHEATYTNLVTNPSGEVNTAGYVVTDGGVYLGAGATLTSDATQFKFGAKSLKVVTTNALSHEGAKIPFTTVAGLNYTLTIWLLGNAGGENVDIQIGNSTAGLVGNVSASLTTSWKRYPVSFTANTTSSVVVVRTTAATTSTWFMDGVMVVQVPFGTIIPYFDGDTPGGFWTGTPHASISTYTKTFNGSYSSGVTHQQPGLLSGPNSSTLALYFRELGLDEDTMLDLDGTKQATLDALGHQPDATVAKYANRKQSDLDLFLQSDIDTDTQFDLERLQDYLSSAYYEVKLVWDATQATVTVLNANGQGYTFDGIPVGVSGGLLTNANYILLVDVLESTLRARIYGLDSQGNIQWSPVIFDSTLITDDSIIHRRKGRFGWYTKLLDGDAYLANIRTRKLNFGEYRSQPLYSDTPVRGTVLHAGAAPDKELVGGLLSAPWGGNITLDTTKSTSGNSFQITNDGTIPLQGVMTNQIYLNNLEDTEISFKIFFPASALSGRDGLVAFLYGEFGSIVQLVLPPITPDRWQEIKIDTATVGKAIQAGKYNVVLVQSSANVPATWYVDKFSVRSRAIRWEGRGQPDDAWHMQTGDWVPFADNINDDNDGIVFAQRGSAMQVRGQARTQDAYIQSVKMIPQYAQLGQFVWKDQSVPLGNSPTPSFSYIVSGHKVTVDGTSSGAVHGADPHGPPAHPPPIPSFIIAYYWTWGDGTFDYGPSPTHVYAQSGTYSVTLTVIDNLNHRTSLTQSVPVV